MARLLMEGLTKVYRRDVVAVDDLSLSVDDGEFMVLVGPSGCGKSTVLRIIAGLEEATRGEIWIGGRRVADLPPKDRDVAMVVQSAASFPYLTVAENIGFGLRLRRRPKPEIQRRVNEVAVVLGLAELLDRRPGELSGGQRQRVAIGRAMLRDPQAFLMDEPLSSLDTRLRIQMRSEIARLHRRLGTTTLYVTHDQEEALMLGDRVAVLNEGVLEQEGTPEDLYRRPASVFVANFIGSPPMNMVEAVVSDGLVSFGSVRVTLGCLDVVESAAARSVIVGIRPSDLSEADASSFAAERPVIDAVVETTENLGPNVDVNFAMSQTGNNVGGVASPPVGGRTYTARLEEGSRVRPGDPIRLTFSPHRLYVFDAETGRSLSAR